MSKVEADVQVTSGSAGPLLSKTPNTQFRAARSRVIIPSHPTTARVQCHDLLQHNPKTQQKTCSKGGGGGECTVDSFCRVSN